MNGRPDYVNGPATPRCSGSVWITSTSTTSTGWIATCRSRRRWAPWPTWSRAGKVRHLGLSEASPADHPPRRPRAHHRRAADRVLPLDPRPRGRGAPHLSRAGDRLRGLQPARPRVPHRTVPECRGLRARRLSPEPPRFQGENFQKNLDLVAQVEEIARRKKCSPPSSRSPGSRRKGGHRAPLRHQAAEVPRGEPGRPGCRDHCRPTWRRSTRWRPKGLRPGSGTRPEG